ncbi:uncharacterized protein [Parasteatoda tepidariorum]|uniref:uncharacterized protein n=1 Tax=Parasteatoda tepidariorum TaxID=114398 RepID=UPI0039BD2F96
MIPKTALIFCTIICYLVGLGIYMSGFMPEAIYKSNYSNSTADDSCLELLQNQESCKKLNLYPYKRQYEKVVLIVIDALRADFVPSILKSDFNTSLPFVESMLQKNNAIAFINKVFSPTVTLPRLKTLMTGKTSNFIDIINNFNAKELKEDTFLHQAKSRGLKAIFYGDETWLKIYPNFFIRSEGTHSFFVQDFVEVDNNVTRHLKIELSRNDWDIMILHYLGVDHIGHAFGPYSSYLKPKLKEMDSIVELIYQSLKQMSSQNSLIVICGDHGMTFDGNHGGVTKGETLTPLIFLNTLNFKFANKNKMVSQVDIAVTLSILLGLPIPKSNSGTLIVDVLQFSNLQKAQFLNAMFSNVMQLYKLNEKSLSNNNIMLNISNVLDLHLSFFDTHFLGSYNQSSYSSPQYEFLFEKYTSLLKLLSSLQRHDSTYDNNSLMFGIIIMWLSVFMLIMCLTVQYKNITHVFYFSFKPSINKTYFSLVLACLVLYLYKSDKHFTFYFIILPLSILIMSLTTFMLYYLKMLLSTVMSLTVMEKLCIVSFILHALSLFSSSYIEKEHILWYFVIATIFILFIIKDSILAIKLCQVDNSNTNLLNINQRNCSNFSALSILIISHFMFRDYAFSCNEEIIPMNFFHLKELFIENPIALFIGQLLTLILFWYKQKNKTVFCLFCFGSILVYVYKAQLQALTLVINMFNINLTTIPQLIYFLVVIIIVYSFYVSYFNDSDLFFESIKNNTVDIICAWILLTHLIGQNYLITYTTVIIVQDIYLGQITSKNKILVNICIYLQMAMYSFFCQGNSNNLSTIDVSSGYVGLSSYQPILVGSLITCNTYRSVILWLLLLYLRGLNFFCDPKLKYNPKIFTNIINSFLYIIAYRFSILALYCIIMYSMKHHLFVLSVFAPKLFYEIAHTFIFIICLSCLILYYYVAQIITKQSKSK